MFGTTCDFMLLFLIYFLLFSLLHHLLLQEWFILTNPTIVQNHIFFFSGLILFPSSLSCRHDLDYTFALAHHLLPFTPHKFKKAS